MILGDVQTNAIQRLDEVRRLCSDMRIGQFLATLGMLGEDATGKSLWDLEDEEFTATQERFAADLARRTRD